jgi:hypothetical protein
MVAEPTELNESARYVFNEKPYMQRTTRNQENEKTLRIEPNDTFLTLKEDHLKYSMLTY